ncbi:matrix metalloproteinase-20 [Conger conger]|uniref:matrix metalloproteinase-20 n=1 Tax=Conger conger TaxID=82655 RepID=UPI002A5A5CF4|nr:matrix metalloproteinase-20 [Conger conger]
MCWLLPLWPLAVVLALAGPGCPALVPGPEDGVTPNDLTLATEYLQHYYDLQVAPTRRRKRSDSALSSKVRDMQRFFGLNATGRLDAETLRVMRTPRCGVPDAHEYVSNQGAKWNKNTISYRVRRYTSDLPASTVDSEIESALNVWSKASPLKFVKSSSGTADILVDFASRSHGDSYPFDGPRGTLAHAFGPGDGIGGDTHFDDAEKWTTGSDGYNLFLVAAHEFGHALGLKHSRNQASLMYPTYKQRDVNNVLSREDTNRISSLYSQRAAAPAWRPQPRWASYFSSWFQGRRYAFRLQAKCDHTLTFHAVTSLGDTTLLFKGSYFRDTSVIDPSPVTTTPFWIICGLLAIDPRFCDLYLWMKQDQQDDIKAVPIHNFLPKIRSGINAAYSIPQRSSVYLFAGSSVWTMKRFRVKGHPKPIRRFGIPKWVKRIDAAVHINTTGHTLMFSQNLYWSYNENLRVLEDFYPRNTSEDFPGVKTPIDAAVYKDGFLHFFHGPEVYKYDAVQKCIVGVDKAKSWLGCRAKSPLKRQLGPERAERNMCLNVPETSNLA